MAKSEFDEYATSYSDAVTGSISFQSEPYEYFLLRKHEELLRIMGPRTGSERLLSVGCGAGVSEALLAPLVAPSAVMGIEPSIPLAQQAGTALAGRVASGLAQQMPFEDGTFDVVFASCVFHHIPPAMRRDAVAEMMRVTAPGGLLCIFEHNPLNPLTRKAVRDCPFDEGAVLLPEQESRTLLHEVGFGSVASRYILFFPRMLASLRRFEPALAGCPLGAQYVTYARK